MPYHIHRKGEVDEQFGPFPTKHHALQFLLSEAAMHINEPVWFRIEKEEKTNEFSTVE